MVLKCLSLYATLQSTYTTGGTHIVALENSLERKEYMFHKMILKGRSFLCNLKKILFLQGNLKIRLEIVLERKNVELLSIWDAVGVLQGELKIEQRGDKLKNYLKLVGILWNRTSG